MSLLSLNFALGDTGDTGDTGTIDDSGDTAVDTGVDTGDTGGDTGETLETGDTDTSSTDTALDSSAGTDTGEGARSRALALAGEKGGFGCAAVGAGGDFTLWVSAMVTGF